MAELEQFKEILKSEMAPVMEKLKRPETNFAELSASYWFIAKQYDQLVKQWKSANENIASLNKTVKETKKDMESNQCLYYLKLMMESMGYGSIYEAWLSGNFMRKV